MNGWDHSCSSVALVALREDSWKGALQRIKNQFAVCSNTAFAMSASGGGGKGVSTTVPLTDSEEAACCELDLHVQAVRDLIIQVYLVTCVVKYLAAAGYHYGGGDEWVRWAFEFAYTWTSTSMLGAAGSSLWPLVLAAGVLDYFCLQALIRRDNASHYIIGGWGLAISVLFFDSILGTSLDMDIFGMAWEAEKVAEDVASTSAGELFEKVPKDLFGIWWPSKLLIVIAWSAIGLLLLAVNELSRRRK